MRIRPLKTSKPRTESVKYGEGSNGRRKLIQAAMEAGFSRRTATKTVDTIVKAWKRAVREHDKHIEMPAGFLKVRKVPKHLRDRRIFSRQIGNRKLGSLHSWKTYTREYQVLWKIPDTEWEELVQKLNENKNTDTNPDSGSSGCSS